MVGSIKRSTSLGICALVAAAGALAAAPTAKAGTITSVYSLFDQNNASAGLNYAVFGLGGTPKTNVDLSLVTVNGNVAVGPSGSLTLAAPSTINGNVDMDSTATPKNPGPGTYTGTLDTNESFGTLATDIANVSTQAEGLTATQTFSSITTGRTITGVSGLNVIDITGNITLGSGAVTLAGPAGAQFIVNPTFAKVPLKRPWR